MTATTFLTRIHLELAWGTCFGGALGIIPGRKKRLPFVLTHTLSVLNLSTASGWHIYLGMLSLMLDDPAARPAWSKDVWKEVHSVYERKYA